MEKKYCGQPTFYNGQTLVYLGTDGNCYPVFPQFIGGVGGRGSRGFQGIQGAQGFQGAIGAQGFQGFQGIDGGTFVAGITSPDGITLTALSAGGVGALSYSWAVKSKFINGTDISFTGPVNAQIATINNGPNSYDGTVVVAITDSLGRVAIAYWHTRKDSVG